ncbi:hypothetical protein LINPERPRIM_LOCUS19803 [Linum perenne]
MLLQYHLHRQSPSLLPQTFRRPLTCYVGKSTPSASLYTWLAEISDPATVIVPVPVPDDGGPVELEFPSFSDVFSTTDDPSPIQIATSVLLTGAIFVFLFRSIRRRIKRAKELRFRSTGATKTLKDEALESLKAIGAAGPVESKKPTSPVQALIGGIAAGVIALILYKFTTTIESSLNRQTISDNFSVRQITITIRTIINGVCYLATFVFGFNSIGLILYSGQLTINALLEGSSEDETQAQGEAAAELQTDQTPDDDDDDEAQ